jgi:cysteine-rich repeat protein
MVYVQTLSVSRRSVAVFSGVALLLSQLVGQLPLFSVQHALAAAPLCNGITATIYVEAGLIVGGPNNGDVYAGVLNGDGSDDVIVGTTGDDTINAGGGNDLVCGDAGNDTIYGEGQDDDLWGDDGNDVLDGGGGADILRGRAGNDELRGGGGADTLNGGAGYDTLRGEGGNDDLDGQADDDNCDGGGQGGDTETDCENTDSFKGIIVINKDASPDSADIFTFTGLGGFTLQDDGDENTDPSQYVVYRDAGVYNVTETADPNWTVQNVECFDADGSTTVDVPNGSAAINIDAGEIVECTFTNIPYVSPLPAGCDFELDPGDDIQAAIDAADAGDVICLNPGLYQQSATITVSEEVTITRTSCDPDVIVTRTAGDTATEAIVDGDGSTNVFLIEANNVTLQCLEVRNGEDDLVYNTTSTRTGLVVKNNIVHDSSDDDGIQLKKAPGALVQYNDVYDIAGDGINLSDGSDGGQILDNRVHDVSTDSGSANGAIYVYNSDNLTISGNLVYDIPNQEGIKVGEGSYFGVGGSVTDNVIVDVDQDAINVYMGDTVVSGNKISDSDSSNGAIYVSYNIDNVSITNNLIENNTTYGVRVGKSSLYPTNVTVNDNCIQGNDDGVIFNAGANPDLNAENNWWGAASGPSGSGPGAGDTVGADIDFDPFNTTGCTLPAIVDNFAPFGIPDSEDDPLDPSTTPVPTDTTPPPVPTHVSPVDGDTLTAAELDKADWTDETDPSVPVTYIYQSSNSPATNIDGSFVTPAYTSSSLTASEIPTPGTPEGTYYWHVRAVDDEGNASAWSTAWSFTVDNSPAPVCTTTDADIAFHIPFDETSGTVAADASGNGIDGAHMNGPVISVDAPIVSFDNPRSLSFDGTDDYLDLGNTAFPTPASFSISAWVKADTIGDDRQVVSKGYNGTQTEWEMKTTTADGKMSFQSFNNPNQVGVEALTPLTADVWTHFVGTFDGTTWSIYMNGSLNNSAAGAAPVSTDRPIYIGAVDNQGTPVQFWDGNIDDVRFYNRVLGPNEVADLYTGSCDVAPFCGDGIIAGAEMCDDNGSLDGDGCDSTCQVEANYNCTGTPSVCVPTTLATPTLLGWNAEDWSLTLDEAPVDLACDPSGVFVNNDRNSLNQVWTSVPGTNVKYIRRVNGVEIPSMVFTTTHMNGWFSFGPGEDGTYDTEVMAFEDDNSNDAVDPGERVSPWSNICTITYADVTPTACLSTDDGLVAHWQFEEGTGTTATDSTVYPNVSSFIGGAVFGFNGDFPATSFINNYSLSVDGVNGHADVVDTTDISFDTTDAFAIAAWVNAPSFSGYQTVVQKIDDSTGAQTGFVITLNNGVPELWMQSDYGAGEYLRVGSTTALTVDAWHHLVMSYDGSGTAAGVQLFLNGTDVTGPTALHDNLVGSIVNAGELEIGNRNDGSFQALLGRIDDVRIYDRTIDGSHVSSLFGGSCDAGTVAPDTDSDGIPDASDNCPLDPNPLQENNDSDSEGDVCDTDDDNDSVDDLSDNCPLDANPLQEDTDVPPDGDGDACDTPFAPLTFSDSGTDSENGARSGKETKAMFHGLKKSLKNGGLGGLAGGGFGGGGVNDDGTTNYSLSDPADLPPGGFGGDDYFDDAQKEVICTAQKMLERNVARLEAVDYLAAIIRDMFNLDSTGEQLVRQELKNSAFCVKQNVARLTKDGLVTAAAVTIPLDSRGYPVSVNHFWNACVRSDLVTLQRRDNPDRDDPRDGGSMKTCADYIGSSEIYYPDRNVHLKYERDGEGNITQFIAPEGYILKEAPTLVKTTNTKS